MANEISSMTQAVMHRSPAQNSGQLPRSEATSVNNEQSLPAEGKDLPQQTENTQAKLREAVDQINDYVQTVQRDLSFNMDDDSGRTVISVIDSGSGELIRQIPTEEVIALASHLQDLSMESVDSSEVTQGILFSDHT